MTTPISQESKILRKKIILYYKKEKVYKTTDCLLDTFVLGVIKKIVFFFGLKIYIIYNHDYQCKIWKLITAHCI